MGRRRTSLRMTLAGAIATIAFSGVLLLIVSASFYGRLFTDKEVAAASSLLQLQAATTLEALRVTVTESASLMQTDRGLRLAVAEQHAPAIHTFLESQFKQHAVTYGSLRIANIYAFDLAFQPLAGAGDDSANGEQVACGHLLAEAVMRSGPDRRKALSGICSQKGKALLGVMVPIGGLRPIGYLLLVADPAPTLQTVESSIGAPIAIRYPSGDTVYESPRWPKSEEILTASHTMLGEREQPWMVIESAVDIGPFRQQFEGTTAAVVGVALIIFVPALILSMLIFNRSLRALRDLQHAAEELSAGHYEKITTSTYPEIMALIDSFNGMAEKVSREIEERKRAEARAEEANKAKSVFLANMSHEIRTPLTAIIGFSETLLEDSTTQSDRYNASNTIIRCGKHLLQIINDILDLSKIEAERLEIERIPVELFQILDDVGSLAAIQAGGKAISFNVDYEFPLPEIIESDPVRLKQILFNLVNNAIKFTNEGGVRVRVAYDAEAGQMRFDVIDTGVGLSEDQLNKLFQAFGQADVSTTRRFGGTGLGLHLSKILSQKLGGDITVESTEGIGSIFVATVDAGAAARERLVDKVPSAVEQRLRRDGIEGRFEGTVLLVDDSADNQQLISWYLRKLGVAVESVENGLHAVTRALARRFDLILMDMQMPVMDGLEATALLRQKGYSGPIVALTANVMKDETDKCMEAGCNSFLGKPIDRKLFRDTLAEHLKPALTAPSKARAGVAQPVTSALLSEDPELADLVNKFVEKLPSYTREIKGLCKERKWFELKERLHDFKSVAGNYGFSELSELAAKAEQELKTEAFSAVAQTIEEVLSMQGRIEQPKTEQDGARAQRELTE